MSATRRAGKALRKAWLARKTPLKRSSKPLRRTRIRRVSKKRAKDMKSYSLLREGFLMANPTCMVCYESPATEVHHKRKRGKHYLDVDTWLSTCRECHMHIHSDPSWAKERGFLE